MGVTWVQNYEIGKVAKWLHGIIRLICLLKNTKLNLLEITWITFPIQSESFSTHTHHGKQKTKQPEKMFPYIVWELGGMCVCVVVNKIKSSKNLLKLFGLKLVNITNCQPLLMKGSIT